MADTTTSDLNARQLAFVQAYLNDARGNATRAAEMAGYAHPGKQVSRLLENVGIKAEIDAWRERVRADGIANIEYRIARLRDLEQKYWDLIDARAADLADETAGGGTGLLVRQYKQVGSGPDARLVTEYVADTATTKELRALYDDAAKELGHRADNLNLDASESFLQALRAFGQGGGDDGNA